MLSILEVLSLGERVVLAAGHEAFVTWNRSVTFQMWRPSETPGEYKEIDIRTYGGVKEITFEEANSYARDWIACPQQEEES